MKVARPVALVDAMQPGAWMFLEQAAEQSWE